MIKPIAKFKGVFLFYLSSNNHLINAVYSALIKRSFLVRLIII